MKNWMWIVVAVAIAALVGAKDAEKPKGVFSMPKVGQAVNLKDHGSAYSFGSIEPEVPLSHTVVEVGEDYVVIRDIVGVEETVVPVYSLKAIEMVKVE